MIIDRLRQIREAKHLKAFYAKYERLLIPGFLFVGFLFDLFAYRTLKFSTTFLILGIYAVVAAAAILYMHAFDVRASLWVRPVQTRLRLAVPLIMQFVFGALLSQSLLFYWFGGSVSSSWPILAVMTGLMISNETFRSFYLRPVVQVGVFTFALFSYCSVLFPYAFNSLSPTIFLLGALVTLAASLLLAFALSHAVEALREKQFQLVATVVVICGLMVSCYFLNLIPPIPLSIRDAGVYHNVERTAGAYRVTAETQPWFQRLISGETIHVRLNDPVYVYAAVFSPANLDTIIVHRWYYYDETKKKWIRSDQFSYKIIGGRAEGYRGFSYKSNMRLGAWRVDVETTRGQTLGRIGFTVERVTELPVLEELQK